jgi:hypothetical protein
MEDTVALIVLNWNGASDTLACLTSFRASSPTTHLIVVDNGSTDGSDSAIEASGLAHTLIRNTGNLGYAGGNNVGLRRALAEGFQVVGVVNNDTVAAPGLVDNLMAALPRGLPRAVSSEIAYFEKPDVCWFAGGAFSDGYGRHLPTEEQRAGPTPLLTGCCLFARREVWERVGLFDESFFLIFEDFDWSLRAAEAGVELLVVEGPRLLHKVSRSFRSSVRASRLGSFYFARNGVRLAWRWQRRCVPLFVIRHVVRPAARGLRDGNAEAAWLLLGAAASLVGQRGAAPSTIVRIS